MTQHEPEIIFSHYTQTATIDGHDFAVEIYKTSLAPRWILSVENQFGTLTVSDTPPYFGDVLAWRAFQELLSEEGIKAFYNKKERRERGL
ncbi:hypothetical protein [Donghicola tyrosinivorans]|uniref:Uncharacterized protein n=1 Tax=Donghicola tyrosinivorans TaxID=1652492 RepID=A0A2T0WTJ8_9RHOB|nr:hypothetical protein [Donghicola tyrosinivorans]PRY90023.1 hypothetical protein CLV74_1052 [Donghicola tyrosinivorans]